MTIQDTDFRWMPLAVLLSAAVLLTGCMSVESNLTLRADGSGTVTERIELNPAAAEMMRSMAQMGNEEGEVSPMFTESQVRERAEGQTGLSVSSITILEDAQGETGYEAVYTFEDVNAITAGIDTDAMVPGGVEGNVSDDAGSDFMFSDMELSFTPGASAELIMRFPPEDEEQETAPEEPTDIPMEDPDAEAMAREMMRGTKMVFTVDIEGTILETNASFREGNRITLLNLDFDALMEADEKEGMNVLDEIMKDESMGTMTQEQLNAYPGFDAETQEEVYVRFQ